MTDGDGITTYPASSGPLDLPIGGQSLVPPRHVDGRWWGTFGGFDLCVRDGSQVVLTGVTLQTTGLRDARALIHLVPPASVAKVPRGQLPRYGAIGSTLGHPPEFDGTSSAPLGSYSTAISGVPVPDCRDNQKWGDELGRGQVPSGTYTELLVTASAGREDGRVRRVWVQFTRNGQQGRQRLPWAMILCGRHSRLRSMCRL